jgi:hypothetical protein
MSASNFSVGGMVLAGLLIALSSFEVRASAFSSTHAAPESLRLYVLDCGSIRVALQLFAAGRLISI